MSKRKNGRPSKHSLLMREVWKRRKAAKEVKVTSLDSPKKMNVRVISHQDGVQIDNFQVTKFGELVDILHDDYMGVAISEILIQTD